MKPAIILTVFLASTLAHPDYNFDICLGHQDDTLIPVSCDAYFRCSSDIGYLENCKSYGPNYQFDASLGDCNHKDVSRCNENHFFSPEPQPRYQPQHNGKIAINAPEYDTKICRRHGDGFLIGIKGSCSLFYFCSDEIAYLDDCKNFGNYQFDPIINDCSHKSIVKCDESLDTVQSSFNDDYYPMY